VGFKASKDQLWLVGDLINRGPHSLKVIRFIKSLGDAAITVLGNHDLHLLAVSQGNLRRNDKDTFHDILAAKDRDKLIDWLRHRPLMHHDAELGFSLLHAGLPPQWDIPMALKLAAEVEQVLQGPKFHDFCHHMYGNEPRRWSNNLEGMDRLRFITNCFTRLRYCDRSGRLNLKAKGPPGSQPADLLPWFDVPGRASAKERIIFGHWSTLGFQTSQNVWSLDTGCLWGGKLSALKINGKKLKLYQVKCPGAQKPGA
jgi:bis(5'-nucleosyl)-tetraphosphatase (symmetrical)